MKLHPEDPRLTAYVLGELDGDDVVKIEEAIRQDPALQSEVEDIRRLQVYLRTALQTEEAKLTPPQRDKILREARRGGKPDKLSAIISMFQNVPRRWLVPAAIAAVVLLLVGILTMTRQEKSDQTAHQGNEANQPKPEDTTRPTPGPEGPTLPISAEANTSADLPRLARREAVTVVDQAEMNLPVSAGHSSLPWIKKSILEEGKLPASDAVRLEEILNAFQLRLNGTASIARMEPPEWHPDDRDQGVPPPVATLSTELLPCPWKPSSVLLFVTVKGNATNESDVKVTFRPDGSSVARYRLLGYSPVDGQPVKELPSRVAAAQSNTVVIEIEPSAPSSELGSLVWSANGKEAPAISLNYQRDREPSDDVRFAALVCMYAQWLAGEQSGIIDAEIVSALARELAGSSLEKDRADFLHLIDNSIRL